MKGRDLLAVARRLGSGQNPTEPNRRTSINRSYYAAFGELSGHIQVRGYVRKPSGSPHDASWKFLKTGIVDGDVQRAAVRRAIADTGFQLKARRLKADYHLSAGISRTEPQDALGEAEAIIKALDSLKA